MTAITATRNDFIGTEPAIVIILSIAHALRLRGDPPGFLATMGHICVQSHKVPRAAPRFPDQGLDFSALARRLRQPFM